MSDRLSISKRLLASVGNRLEEARVEGQVVSLDERCGGVEAVGTQHSLGERAEGEAPVLTGG